MPSRTWGIRAAHGDRARDIGCALQHRGVPDERGEEGARESSNVVEVESASNGRPVRTARRSGGGQGWSMMFRLLFVRPDTKWSNRIGS